MSATARQNISLRRQTLLGNQEGAFAIARYVRTTPQKTRRVADLVRGTNVDDALAILQFQPQDIAQTLYKLVGSAVANAEDGENLKRSDLVVSAITVDEGPTMKRWRPRAKGAANRVLKRSSHITVVVQPADVLSTQIGPAGTGSAGTGSAGTGSAGTGATRNSKKGGNR